MAAKDAVPTDLADLQLRFGGRLVEQLGAQMYPSATATVAELISNAWDADARHVWVDMPLGDWRHGEIVVVDDGLGMSHAEAREAYLVVGRNRRATGGQRTPGGRLVHGRKGIGKLAAFGTATVLELKTKKAGEPEVAFRLDYEKIRKQDPDVPYVVEPSQDLAPLVNPSTGELLDHGTRVRLTGLRLKRRLNKQQFVQSMSRRFSFGDREMVVHINREPLPRFELDLDVRFPPNDLPPGARADGSWAVETLSNGEEVKWWIGFTQKPLRGEAEQGISVLVRGKLAQRPFKFERSTGTTGQLGQEYLVGEVIADWIDDDDDDDPDRDYIQSNRDQLQLEDEGLLPFLEWGQQRLRWALEARNKIRAARNMRHLEQLEALQSLAEPFPLRERAGLMRVAEAVSRLPEVSDTELVKVMQAVVQTREGEIARALAEEIVLEGDEPARFWPLLGHLSELDGRTARSFVDSRVDVLSRLASLSVGSDLAEALRRLLSLNPGLADPAWESAEAEEQAGRGLPEVYVIKHPRRETPSAIVATIQSSPKEAHAEARRAQQAVPGVPAFFVTSDALAAEGPDRGTFMTWESFLQRSQRLHEGWLEVLDRRAARSRGVS